MKRTILATTAATAMLFSAAAANAITSTADLTTQTPTDVAQSLVGPGVAISNVTFTGADTQGGTFAADPATIGFGSGVVLTSGLTDRWIGPNESPVDSFSQGGAGDADLSALSGFDTYDAAILEFDFTADAETVYFRYVFGSEEYSEFVGSQYNDVFAFYVNGTNCATVPLPEGGTGPVTINTINGGYAPSGQPAPFDASAVNPDLYVDNPTSAPTRNTEMDGFTIPLTCMANVDPAGVNHMKLAIADASDGVLDSAVFLEQGSLSTTPPVAGTGKVTGGGRIDTEDGFFTFGGAVIEDEQGLRGNLQINDHAIGARFHGTSATGLSVSGSTATWSGEGRLNGEDGYSFTAEVVDNRNGNAAKKGDPDTVLFTILDASDAVVWTGSGDLRRGNITVHDAA